MDTISEILGLRAGTPVSVMGTVKIAKEPELKEGVSARTGKDYSFISQWALIEDDAGAAIGISATSLRRWMQEGDIVTLTSDEDGRQGSARIRTWETSEGETRHSIQVGGSHCKVLGACPTCGADLNDTTPSAASTATKMPVSSPAAPAPPAADDDIPF